MKKTFRHVILSIAVLLSVMSSFVSAGEIIRTNLNKSWLFSEIDPESDFEAGDWFFYNNCSSSFEIPLWDNRDLKGGPRAYKTIESHLGGLEGRKYDQEKNGQFKYESSDFTYSDSFDVELKKHWYTHSTLNGKFVSEEQTDALNRKTETWPIRALVIAKTKNVEIAGKDGVELEINTLSFDEKGNVVDGAQPRIKKRVGFACSSLFLINGKTLESSIGGIGVAFTYYAPEQRMCHFFPEATFGTWWVTVSSLEKYRQELLTYCKSPYYIPLEADGSNKAQVEEFEKSVDQKHLQSFIPSELDLNKPIEATNFILTVRFSDPVTPVYHASLPNVCLVDCPNTGAKQIEGLELKIKPIETKKNRQK